METMSLKALANKVLQGNRKGNPVETAKKLVAEGKIKPVAEEPLITGYELSERMAIMGENCEPDQTKPYITDSGDLVIPTYGDPKYHYWNGGQSVLDTLKELKASEEITKRYKFYSN